MKKLAFITAALALCVLACCSDDPVNEWNGGNQGGVTPGGQIGGNATGDDLENFDIQFDTSELTESETIPADDSDDNYNDYVENSVFSRVVNVAFSGTTATVSGDTDGVDITTDGAHVTLDNGNKQMEVVVTGSTSNGSLKLYSDYKFKLTLNGVEITNPTGPAINNQSHKRTFVELATGSSNTLVDGASYTSVSDDEDCKGCFFSEGQLIFSGSGTLNVTASCKNGIVSDDYLRFRPGNVVNVSASAGNALKSNDGVTIGGGVLNLSVSGAAAKGINSEAFVTIDGGRTTIITTGNGEYDSSERDTKACAGIKADSTFIMNSGELYIKSTGTGGKGVSSDQSVTFNGGTVKILTTGKRFTYSSLHSSAKGIKAGGDLVIAGGVIKVRTSGGEGSEGIESKTNIAISGGTVEASSYDDAINVAARAGALMISGGKTYAYSSNNDAVDSNGTITISGGTLIAAGSTQPEGGIDCDNNALLVNGGVVIGLGGENSTISSQSKQVSLVSGNSITAGTLMTVTCASNNVLCYSVPRTFSSMMISSPLLVKGSAWAILSGGTVSGGSTFHGLTTGGTASGASSVASGTLSAAVNYSNASATGGGGGFPGGGGWH